MIYIEIEGEKYPCRIETFHTQMGQQAIRVIGNAPLAHGFKLYSDDTLLEDFSDYTYAYRIGETIKEYTVNEEEIIVAESYSSGVPESPIQKQINSINNRITSITPYEETKTAYIDDTEVFFDKNKDGNVLVFMVDGDGKNVPFEYEEVNGQIRVSFEQRESLATVTILIQ